MRCRHELVHEEAKAEKMIEIVGGAVLLYCVYLILFIFMIFILCKCVIISFFNTHIYVPLPFIQSVISTGKK